MHISGEEIFETRSKKLVCGGSRAAFNTTNLLQHLNVDMKDICCDKATSCALKGGHKKFKRLQRGELNLSLWMRK